MAFRSGTSASALLKSALLSCIITPGSQSIWGSIAHAALTESGNKSWCCPSIVLHGFFEQVTADAFVV